MLLIHSSLSSRRRELESRWSNATQRRTFKSSFERQELAPIFLVCASFRLVLFPGSMVAEIDSFLDPPAFKDAKKYVVEPKQTFRTANFARASTRIPGVKHSPSAVQDITSAFHHASIQGQQQGQDTRSRPVSGAYGSGAASPNKSPGEVDGHLAQQQSRFSVAPLQSPSRSPMAAIGNAGAKAGQAVAAAFQRKEHAPALAPPQAPASMPTFSSARSHSNDLPSLPPSHSQTQYADADTSSTQPPVPSSSTAEDDDDPLLRAINQLASTPPLRIVNANTPPMVGGIALPGLSDPMKRQASFESRQRQQSLGRPMHGSSSRPSSPGPVAAMMEGPSRGNVPQVVEQYGQAFPNERSMTRSPSQPPPHHHQQQQQPRSMSHANEPQQQQRPQSLVGIGARGRSPSPQPFQQPQEEGGMPLSTYGAPAPPTQHYQVPSQARPPSPLVPSSASTYSIGASVNAYANDGHRTSQYSSPATYPQVTPQQQQQQQQQSAYPSPAPSVQQPYYPSTSAQGFHPQQPYQQGPPPPHSQYQQPIRPASIVSQSSSYQGGPQYYASSPAAHSQASPAHVFRTNSSASGYSAHSGYASNASQYAPPPPQQQPPPPVQHARGPSTQFSSDGKKILMYGESSSFPSPSALVCSTDDSIRLGQLPHCTITRLLVLKSSRLELGKSSLLPIPT